jgi:hypothetical protein
MTDKKEDHTYPNQPGVLLRFFIWCSAADIELLKRCPQSEMNKYAGVGATVFFTGMLAFLSGGYALFTVFKSVWLGVLIGLFWGSLVFNLDRFIVSTIKKSEKKFGQWKQMLPRLILAVFLSLVISKPLELKIFEQEIDEVLYYTGNEKVNELDELYQGRVADKEAQIITCRNTIAKMFDQREQYYEDYKCECEGTCGTGKPGLGTECRRKKAKYEQFDIEYQETKSQNDALIANVYKEIEALQEEYEENKAELQNSFADGLMARIEAANTLPRSTSLAVVLLLVCIEIAPIFTKMLSPYGPYDHLLKTIEYEYEIDEITAINQRNQNLNNKLTVMASLEKGKVDQEIVNNEKIMELISEAHIDIVKEQLEILVEQEKEQLRNQSNSNES